MRYTHVLAAVLAAAIACAAPAAAEPGDWLLRTGVTQIEPDDDNGDLDGTDVGVDVNSAASMTFEVTYMWTDNIGIELLAAYPFQHDIDLDGLGQVGETKHLPPTLSLQYHFTRWGAFKPYVGAGVNFTYFFDEDTQGALDGSDLDLDESWGFAAQLGVDYDIGNNWFLNANIRYISIETDAEVDGTEVAEVEIDPLLYGLNVGYRF